MGLVSQKFTGPASLGAPPSRKKRRRQVKIAKPGKIKGRSVPPKLQAAARNFAHIFLIRSAGAAQKGKPPGARYGNIHGVSVGPKYKKGQITDELCIRVHVRRKYKRLTTVPKKCRVDEKFGGACTDVCQMGVAKPYGFLSPGEGIGVNGGLRGTVGLILKAAMPGNEDAMPAELFLLTSNHVISCNGAYNAQRVFHPPPAGAPQAVVVGEVTDYWPVDAAQLNIIDAAIAWTGKQVLDPLLAGQHQFGTTSIAAAIGMRVFKFGIGSSFSEGVITGLNARQEFDYSAIGMGRPEFTNLIMIETASGAPFARAGDSGACVWDAATRRPVAMIIGGATMTTNAGTRHVTFASSIQTVLDVWGARLWNG